MRATWRLLAAALLAGAALAGGGCAGVGGDGALVRTERPALPGSDAETPQRRHARILLALAAGYYEQGKYEIALDELRETLRVDPNYAQAYGLLGVIRMDMGERARAEESFRRALALSPDDADLNNSYGWFLCQSGRAAQSIAYFERALRDPLYPTPAKPLHNAGVCSQRAGDERAAESYFERALRAAPGDPIALYSLARINLARGDARQAKRYSDRLVETQAPTPETLWLALRIARAVGDADSQASLATQLRRRFPDSRETRLLEAGKFEE